MDTKEYKGQKIIAQAQARLVPPDDDYPDCMCDLVLTERSFYVLEDNYNKTYTEHFSIPVSCIDEMKILGGSSDGKGSSSPMSAGISYALLFIIGIFTRSFLFLIGNHRDELTGNYIRLDYSDDLAVKKELFFRELSRPATNVVSCWNKIRG